MRVYESTYILSPELEEEEITKIQEKYSQMVLNSGGEIVSVENWGKRKLGYEIKGHNEGIYVIMRFNSEDTLADKLRDNMKIDDNVIRSLHVRLN